MNDSTAPRATSASSWALRLLAPLGQARAQWVIARTYAIFYLVRYHLSIQYARTSLGFLWVVLAPLCLVAVYMPILLVVFRARLPGRDSPLDYAVFGMIGLVIWSAVADAIGQGASSLAYNPAIVRHSPTPPILLPLVKVIASFVWFAVALTILTTILLATGNNPRSRLLLLPVAYVLTFFFALGFTLMASIFVAYVRDFLHALPTLLTIEFVGAPITYAPEMATGRIAPFVQWNPLTPFLTLFRSALLPWQPFEWSQLGLAALWAVVFCVLGLLVFRRLEGGLKDVVA